MTRCLRFAAERHFFLPVGACVALVWANTLPISYFTVAHHLSFAVNEIGMSLFFGLMAATLLDTATPLVVRRDWRQALLALTGAAGGILGSTAVYLGCLSLGDEASLLAPGWPIACGADLAFAYLVAVRVCSPPAIPFLLLLCSVGNAIGLVVIGFWYPETTVHAGGGLFLALAAAVISAAVLRRRAVSGVWPYLFGCGALAWCALFLTGAHPALALVPVVPFLSRTARVRGLAAVQTVPAQLVLFLLGLTNAGVVVRSAGTGTWALAVATLAGKPAGTMLGISIAATAGLRLPRGVGWRDMIIVSAVSASGFMAALLFAAAAIPVGPVLNEFKLGALMTGGAALLTFAVARVLRVPGTTGQQVPVFSPASPYAADWTSTGTFVKA